MTYEERLELFKSRVTTTPCTFADETDREGITYEIRDEDYEWLLKALDDKDTVIESFSRIIGGMEEDYNELKRFKADAEKLFQRQKLGFKKLRETSEQMEADRDYWKSKCLLLQRQ